MSLAQAAKTPVQHARHLLLLPTHLTDVLQSARLTPASNGMLTADLQQRAWRLLHARPGSAH